MIAEPVTCPICYRNVPEKAATGPRRTFCTPACRRESEHGVARCRRRISKLEDELGYYRRLLETPSRNEEVQTAVGPLTAKQAIKNIEAAIGREVDRIRLLTADAEVNGNAPGA